MNEVTRLNVLGFCKLLRWHANAGIPLDPADCARMAAHVELVLQRDVEESAVVIRLPVRGRVPVRAVEDVEGDEA